MSKNYTSKPQSAYNYQSYIKFQSIWRALDFVQICPKLYECQHFETLNIKIVIGIKEQINICIYINTNFDPQDI